MPRSKSSTSGKGRHERTEDGRLNDGEGKTPYRIEWRPKAREDLRVIVRYIGKDNPTRARGFGQELRDKTRPLAQHPELGRTGRPGLPDSVRELVVHPNYIVFYRVLVEALTVEIFCE